MLKTNFSQLKIRTQIHLFGSESTNLMVLYLPTSVEPIAKERGPWYHILIGVNKDMRGKFCFPLLFRLLPGTSFKVRNPRITDVNSHPHSVLSDQDEQLHLKLISQINCSCTHPARKVLICSEAVVICISPRTSLWLILLITLHKEVHNLCPKNYL